MEQFSLQLAPIRHVYTVRELNTCIRGVLDEHFTNIWVSGEISGSRLASSGHYYFTLKDGDSQLKCACFRMSARYLRFKPQDGVCVIARGRIDVYEARGEYQMLVEHLEPQGHGALQFAFEQLKKKLAAEGLFEASRKRPLPGVPRRIGIITSPDGAALHDLLQIASRRFPGLHVRIWPALVQGEGSIGQVCRGLRFFSQSGWAEVVILARGGGSLEDLWTFNEEEVARAIAACGVPVVSAIGHETDFTIADFVADLRAPTPSAAAELVVRMQSALFDSIEAWRKRLEQAVRYRLSIAGRRIQDGGANRAEAVLHRRIGRQVQRVDELQRCAGETTRRFIRSRTERWREFDGRLRRMDLRLRFSEAHRRTEALQNRLREAMRMRTAKAGSSVEQMSAQLGQLSPLRVLERGYALVRNESGALVKSPADALPGSGIRVRLAEGELRATVEKAKADQG